MEDEYDEYLERALADVEILTSAYPDEVTTTTTCPTPRQFPLHVTLHFSETAHVDLEWTAGYPETSNITIASYRSSSNPKEKLYMEAALDAIRQTAAACLNDGVEGGLACCAAAMDAWNDKMESQHHMLQQQQQAATNMAILPQMASSSGQTTFDWISGEPLVDRKSTFIAHVCRITCEADVKLALHQLIGGNAKLLRATHNMVR